MGLVKKLLNEAVLSEKNEKNFSRKVIATSGGSEISIEERFPD